MHSLTHRSCLLRYMHGTVCKHDVCSHIALYAAIKHMLIPRAHQKFAARVSYAGYSARSSVGKL